MLFQGAQQQQQGAFASDRRVILLEPASEDALASLARVEAALAASCLQATLIGHSSKVHDVAFSAVCVS